MAYFFSVCVSLSLSRPTSSKGLSVSSPLLPSSTCLLEEVTVQGGGYDRSILLLPQSNHIAEHMLQLHPLAAVHQLTITTTNCKTWKRRKEKKNQTQQQLRQSLDQIRSTVWSLWHNFILNPGQIRGIIFIRAQLRQTATLWNLSHANQLRTCMKFGKEVPFSGTFVHFGTWNFRLAAATCSEQPSIEGKKNEKLKALHLKKVHIPKINNIRMNSAAHHYSVSEGKTHHLLPPVMPHGWLLMKITAQTQTLRRNPQVDIFHTGPCRNSSQHWQ